MLMQASAGGDCHQGPTCNVVQRGSAALNQELGRDGFGLKAVMTRVIVDMYCVFFCHHWNKADQISTLNQDKRAKLFFSLLRIRISGSGTQASPA